MAIHASRRLAALLAILLALGGFTLLIVATDEVDQAAMLAAIGLVCLSVAVYVAAALPAPPSTDDVFESIA